MHDENHWLVDDRRTVTAWNDKSTEDRRRPVLTPRTFLAPAPVRS